MCNTINPNPRPLIIEVMENGKVSLPPFVHAPDQQLTLDELKKCRDYIDLIIANPDNFHVVKPHLLQGKIKITYCDTCGEYGKKQDVTSSMCHDCERKQILSQVNPPFDYRGFEESNNLTPEQMDLVNIRPVPVVKVNFSEHQASPAQLKEPIEIKIEEVTAPFVDAMNSVEIGMQPLENNAPYTRCIGCDKKLGERNRADGFCNMCKSKAGK